MKRLSITQKNILYLMTFDNKPTRIDEGIWWEDTTELVDMRLIVFSHFDPGDKDVSYYTLTELGRVYAEFPNLPAPV